MKNTSSSRSRNPFHQALLRLACVAWLAMAAGSAQAANKTWSNGAGGDYTNAANWTGGVPGSNDLAYFALDASYSVALTANVITNNAMEIDGHIETVNLNLNSNTLVLVSAGSSFKQSASGFGSVQTNTVTIRNGTLLMPNNDSTYISANYLESSNSVSMLTFSNLRFNANTFGVAYGFGGAHAGAATWNMYDSTVTLGTLKIAGTEGYDGVICSGNILVGGGSTLTVTNEVIVGNYGIPTGNITVSNGTFNALGGILLGDNGAPAIGNLNIVGNGQVYAGGVGVQLAYGTYGNVSLNGPNALLEANTIAYSLYTGHVSLTNNGGVLQFTSALPVITPINFGDFIITNGTVSFRAITNADVKCNQSGKPLSYLTKFKWTGTNAFRLNNATNLNSGQGYSFYDSGTPRNFVRLELLNGSMYRGGTVYFTDGGSLYLSGGASTISQDLSVDVNATVEFDLRSTNAPGCLLLASTASLLGCNLQLDLANPPIINTPFLIISNTMADASSYTFAGSSTKQSFTLNGTNYITTINVAGGGTEVVVQTAVQAYGTTVFFH